MKHDLDAINAAIALGDRVIPPNGCEVRYYDMYHKCEYVGDIIITKKYGTTNSYYNSTIKTRYTVVNMHLDKKPGVDDKLLEVLFIPKNAPSFEEWKRY